MLIEVLSGTWFNFFCTITFLSIGKRVRVRVSFHPQDWEHWDLLTDPHVHHSSSEECCYDKFFWQLLFKLHSKSQELLIKLMIEQKPFSFVI